MNYLDSYSFYFDRSITAAWEAQRKYVTTSPRLNEALQYGDELFARFAACYADLRALPRGAQRRLQRRLPRSERFCFLVLILQIRMAFRTPGMAQMT
jgi:hypothetical protein